MTPFCYVCFGLAINHTQAVASAPSSAIKKKRQNKSLSISYFILFFDLQKEKPRNAVD
jgi:hypothetical protein